MSKFSWLRTMCYVCVLCALGTTVSLGQSVKLLASFNGTDGSDPFAGLIQGTDGNFYGTAAIGGANNYGTVFRISPAGRLTTVYSFCSQPKCTDGGVPSVLTEGTDSNFYGTTIYGGASGSSCVGFPGCGTVFKITPAGKLTTLYSFCSQVNCTDGWDPRAGLVQAADGNFYGTASAGPNNNDNCPFLAGCGTVFKITPAGKLTTLYTFCSQANCSDGTDPEAGLIEGSDGKLYGTTFYGGRNTSGTVFKITPGGRLTSLYSFCSQTNCDDGGQPFAGLTQGTDGNFYGTTFYGGRNTSGTVFKITPGGRLTSLYSFCSQTNCSDGEFPIAGLVQATDRNFYGATSEGGIMSTCDSLGCGTVFKITPAGKMTTLHSFEGNDGGTASAGLLQATNGNFYGTTTGGGDLSCNPPTGCGVVFRLSVGLGRFVATRPTSGKVESAVVILGNNLTGATNVTFNGTKAVFKTLSSTEIKTRVPSGATTGFVRVTTPKKTLKSNVIFRVTK